MDDGQVDVEALMRRAADDERRLLKREQRAERELVEARAELEQERERLRRARKRVEARQAVVTKAEERLRRRQAARADGPTAGANGDSVPLLDGSERERASSPATGRSKAEGKAQTVARQSPQSSKA